MSDAVVTTRPRVTVAMPVYNGEEFLAPAVESILGQTMGDFELIVTDNASTDATEEMVRGWMRQDARIRYDRSPVNRGLAWNWNRAVPMARGHYFKWAAADDVHLPRYLERTVERLEDDPTAVLAHSRTAWIDEHGQVQGARPTGLAMDAPTPHERFHALTHRGWGCFPLFGVIRREALQRTGLHGAYPRSDRALLAELGLHGRLVEVDEVLFHHRDFSGRVTRATDLRTRYPIFSGGAVPAVPTPYWDLLGGFVGGVRRAPLPAVEKAHCLLALHDYAWRDRRHLVREAAQRVAYPPARRGRSPRVDPATTQPTAPASQQ